MNDNWTTSESPDEVIPWICTADGLLGGVLVMLIVALATAGALARAEDEIKRLESELAQVQQSLRDALALLAERDEEIRRLTATLVKKEEELRQAKALLVKKDDEIKELRKFAAADRALALLIKEMEELTKKLKALTAERDKLALDLRAASDERDRLSGRLADAEKAREKLAKELAARPTSADAEEWKKRLEELRKEIERIQAELAARPTLADVADWKKKLDDLRKEIEARPTVHQELLGLKGGLRKVVILLDHSGSMNIKDRVGAAGRESRWLYCKDIIRSWLRHLDMEECVLVVFSTGVTVYPAEVGKTFRLKASAADRAELDKVLSDLPTPIGATNTLDALREVYKVPDVTSVILFTDGKPEADNAKTADLQQQILALVNKEKRERKQVPPINAVGLGNYFEKDLAGFLMQLADESGGVFLGR